MIKSKKKSNSKTQSINPQIQQHNLVQIKRKKQQQYQILKLKTQIQNQLKLIKQKDQSLLKHYLNKKHSLLKQKQKQSRYIHDIQYKQLILQRQNILNEQQKLQTQTFKNKLKSGLTNSYQKFYQTKKNIANSTKKTINQWKSQKSLRQQKLLQLNQSRFNETQIKRNLSRQSNRSFFQQRHSRIVKKSKLQLNQFQKQSNKDQKQINQMQKNLLYLKSKSQNKLKLIQQIQSDILSVKNQTLSLSRSKMQINKNYHSSRLNSQQNIDQKDKQFTLIKKLKQVNSMQRKLSLPIIRYKKIHNQI